jgi:hypothetical protein
MSVSDIVTILASLPSTKGGERKAATKTITPDGKGGLAIADIYKGTKWWSGHERSVDSIDTFAELLEKVSRDPFAMIVRGRIAGEVDRSRMLRRKTTRARRHRHDRRGRAPMVIDRCGQPRGGF